MQGTRYEREYQKPAYLSSLVTSNKTWAPGLWNSHRRFRLKTDNLVYIRSRFTPAGEALTARANEIERKTPFFMWKEVFERFFSPDFLAALAKKSGALSLLVQRPFSRSSSADIIVGVSAVPAIRSFHSLLKAKASVKTINAKFQLHIDVINKLINFLLCSPLASPIDYAALKLDDQVVGGVHVGASGPPGGDVADHGPVQLGGGIEEAVGGGLSEDLHGGDHLVGVTEESFRGDRRRVGRDPARAVGEADLVQVAAMQERDQGVDVGVGPGSVEVPQGVDDQQVELSALARREHRLALGVAGVGAAGLAVPEPGDGGVLLVVWLGIEDAIDPVGPAVLARSPCVGHDVHSVVLPLY